MKKEIVKIGDIGSGKPTYEASEIMKRIFIAIDETIDLKELEKMIRVERQYSEENK